MTAQTKSANLCLIWLIEKNVNVSALTDESLNSNEPNRLKSSWLKENAETVKANLNHRFESVHEVILRNKNNHLEALISIHNIDNENIYRG
ncbi:MAG: hypothetical protein KBC56_04870 [Flavobacterium sp.]|nr:hypothetical protein [Flavobacterium sp.]